MFPWRDHEVTPKPIASGCESHVTAFSDQLEASRVTSAREPTLCSGEKRCSLADATTQPAGTLGIRKRTSVRFRPLTTAVSAFRDPPSTFKMESAPLFEAGLPSSTQASASTGAWTVTS